jgi:hypothetical protein
MFVCAVRLRWARTDTCERINCNTETERHATHDTIFLNTKYMPPFENRKVSGL